MAKNRRRKVDPAKRRAGKLGIEENTRRRRHDRKVVAVLKQNHPDVLKQIERFLLKQDASAGKAQNPFAGVVKADLARSTGVTGMALRPRKTPVKGAGGFLRNPRKSTVKGKKVSLKKEAGSNKKDRVRNEIWDAVCEVFKLDPVTKAEQKKIGGIVRDLKLKGATPDEIRLRADRYKVLYPGPRFFTATAVLSHWDRLAQPVLFGGSRVPAKPGKYDGLKTIDLRGPEPPVLPGEAEAADLADADQGPRVEPDRPTVAGDTDFPF